MIPRQNAMNIFRQAALPASSLLLAAAAAFAGQSRFDELAIMGEQAMNAGKYDEAVKHYEQIVEKGQTYVSILEVRFDLAWAYYLTGNYEKAIPLFEGLSGVRAPSQDVKEQSLFLMAECEGRWAGTFEAGTPERKKHVQKALELHNKFQSEFPKNPNIPESLYGRAYAYLLDDQYEKAATDLLTVINNYRNAACHKDAQYLLASVYSRQGRDSIRGGKRDEAQGYMEKARKIFEELTRLEGNLSLANDSAFSMAETWYEAEMFRESIRYYMQVRAQREVLVDLGRRLDAIRLRLSQDYQHQRDPSATRAQLALVAEQAARVRKAPDLMISAFFRCADCFYRMERFAECRAVLKHLMKFTSGEQLQEAHYRVVTTYLEEQDADGAAREYDDFIATQGLGLPIADVADVAIAQLFLADPERIDKAVEMLERSLETYPEGSAAEDALYLKFSAEFMIQRYEASAAGAALYLEKYPEGKYVPNALYMSAMSLANIKKWDESLASVNRLLTEFPEGSENFQDMDAASFQKGWILTEAERYNDAVEHYNEFLVKHKDSKYAPNAMYQQALALEKADRKPEARNVLRKLAARFPDHEVGPPALYQVAVMYYNDKDFIGMFGALQDVVDAFPRLPIAVESYYWMGWIAKAKDGLADEAIACYAKALEADPDGPLAADSLLNLAQSCKDYAESMGLPTVMPAARRAAYNNLMRDAMLGFEELMTIYPDSEQALQAVPAMAEIAATLTRLRQLPEADGDKLFAGLIAKYRNTPSFAAQMEFSYGSYLMKIEKREAALAAFKKSLETDPRVLLAPSVLSDYAAALVEAGDLNEAEEIYIKIVTDYAESPNALAPAYYGLAGVKFLQKEDDEARDLYNKVIDESPWFQEGKKGRVKVAEIEERAGNYPVAEKLYEQVWKEETGEVRLGAMLGVARCQLAIAEKEGFGTPVFKNNIKVADENLTKLVILFGAFPEYVSEALWHKGRAYELNRQKQEAADIYSRVAREHQKSKWAKPANERLQQLLREGIAPK